LCAAIFDRRDTTPAPLLWNAVNKGLMIEAMQQVVPDVHIDVQYSISNMWAKSAEMVVDEEGRLAVWNKWVVEESIESSGVSA
jgi:hypothetical protein